jgi:hypothetical protein
LVQKAVPMARFTLFGLLAAFALSSAGCWVHAGPDYARHPRRERVVVRERVTVHPEHRHHDYDHDHYSH